MDRNIKIDTEKDRVKSILKSRASALKIPLIKSDESKNSIECLKFRLDEEIYAIDSTYISEVISVDEITPLPCTPPFILGIINIRGRIISIIDIKRFFNISNSETEIDKIVIVKHNEIEIGIVTNEIIGNFIFDLNRLQTDITTITENHFNHIIGVSKNCEIILDIKEILMDERIIINDKI